MAQGLPYMVQKIRGTAPEQQVKGVFQALSGAIQTYEEDHGRYPEGETDLYFGNIVYLKEMYCGEARGDYAYHCEFTPKGYLVTATPLRQGLPRYRMGPGPVVERF